MSELKLRLSNFLKARITFCTSCSRVTSLKQKGFKSSLGILLPHIIRKLQKSNTSDSTSYSGSKHFQLKNGSMSTDISSTTLRLQTFRLLLYTRIQDSYTSNFCFSKSLFTSIPTYTYSIDR